MTPSLLRKATAMMLLIYFRITTVGGSSLSQSGPQLTEEEGHPEGVCPPCEVLFSKLERTGGEDGKLAQEVLVQERGEPKSGTGVMFFWASAALIHACDYLQELFGKESCRVVKNDPGENGWELEDRNPNHTLLFESALGGMDARCSCETIDRVYIVMSMAEKHTLPVNTQCAFAHSGGMERKGVQPCSFPDGSPVNSHEDLWRCMLEADCTITDDWFTMAVFRDPRPTIVSAYFHIEAHTNRKLGDLDAFVARELPLSCQWLAARYILFAGTLADRSMEVWHSDAMADPLGWHYRWFYEIGLQLPFHVVEATARAAAADDIVFAHKTVDQHPGEEPMAEEGARRFEDEVSPETLELAEAVLRRWLPPVLLERFGVGL